MPRDYRLSRADLNNTRGFARGNGRFVSVIYGVIPGRNTPGSTVVVSKKVAARAVKRNAIKRRARPILFAALQKAQKPLVIICIVKKGAGDAAADEFRGDLGRLLEKVLNSQVYKGALQ